MTSALDEIDARPGQLAAPGCTNVFVLTHHPRPPLEMEGGTTSTVRQYLLAGSSTNSMWRSFRVLLGSSPSVSHVRLVRSR